MYRLLFVEYVKGQTCRRIVVMVLGNDDQVIVGIQGDGCIFIARRNLFFYDFRYVVCLQLSVRQGNRQVLARFVQGQCVVAEGTRSFASLLVEEKDVV